MSALVWSQYIFLTLGILALGTVAVTYIEARTYHSLQSRMFDAPQEKAESAAGRVMNRGSREGPEVGRLEIPRLGLSALVLDGTNSGALRLGVGHIRGTALPGSAGNVGIAGHRDTFFRPLRLIRRDDEIRLLTPDGQYRYLVEFTRVVGPEDVGVLRPTKPPTLTLVTCYPFYFIGAAPKRFIVRARRILDDQVQVQKP